MMLSRCKFINNLAYSTKDLATSIEGSGGAVFYDCDSTYLECQLFIGNETQFIGNRA